LLGYDNPGGGAAVVAPRLDAARDMHLNCVSILKRARGSCRLMNFA